MSLEWLTRDNKSIPKPLVVEECYDRYAGFYVPPDRDEFWINDKIYYPRESHGLIFVNGNWPDDIAGTLAHEYRHHCQFFNGVKFVDWDWTTPNTIEDYEKSIVKYFSIDFELDALLFQHRRAPSDWSRYVLELIRK